MSHFPARETPQPAQMLSYCSDFMRGRQVKVYELDGIAVEEIPVVFDEPMCSCEGQPIRVRRKYDGLNATGAEALHVRHLRAQV